MKSLFQRPSQEELRAQRLENLKDRGSLRGLLGVSGYAKERRKQRKQILGKYKPILYQEERKWNKELRVLERELREDLKSGDRELFRKYGIKEQTQRNSPEKAIQKAKERVRLMKRKSLEGIQSQREEELRAGSKELRKMSYDQTA